MIDREHTLGKLFALLSYVAFIVNGTFVRIEALAFVSGISGLAALVSILPYWREFPRYIKWTLGLIGLCLIPVAAKAFIGPVAFTFLALVPASIAIAIYIYKYPGLFRIRLILTALLAYFFIYIAVGGDPEFVFAGSRNQISTVLIAFGALALAMESRKTDLFLALSIFVASVLAVGSSGVIASGILLLATIFRQQERLLVKVAAAVAISISFVGFEIYLQYYASAEFTAKFSFDRLTATDVRFQIISDYVSRYMEGLTLWLGPPDQYTFYVYSEIASGGTFGYVDSLHNSYLSVHAKIGAMAIFMYAVIVAVMVALRRNYYLFLLLLAILTRAFGDSVFILDGYYNFCFYYFFIVASQIRFGVAAVEGSAPDPKVAATGHGWSPSGSYGVQASRRVGL